MNAPRIPRFTYSESTTCFFFAAVIFAIIVVAYIFSNGGQS
jgi:hypothetical protein